jgi:hypothetical protein
MRDDALAAVEDLVRGTGVGRLSFVGTRWGALVAAAAAARFADAPLVLWEPVTDAARYFREVFRSALMRALRDGAKEARSAANMTDELHRTGSVDVLGYPIHATLYDSASSVTLAGAIGRVPRPALVLQMGPGGRREYVDLGSQLEQRGFQVDVRQAPQREQAWWFIGDEWAPDERRAATITMIETTTEWIARRFSSEQATT